MRICSHCGGRGKLPNFEMELIDPEKGITEGNVKMNEMGTQPCFTCEGRGYIAAQQIPKLHETKNSWIGDPDEDFTDLGDIVIGMKI